MGRLLTGFFIVLIGMSCTKGVEYAQYQSTDSGSWHRDQIMEFQFEPADTLAHYSAFILLRNDNAYPYSNLFLIAERTGPDGESQRDTLEYEMADPAGNWMGSGTGSVVENKLGYIKDVVFPVNGVYTVRISHAMRRNGSVEGLETLPGVLDVGLQLELNQE